MSNDFYKKHRPMTTAEELLLIGQHSELGMAFVNEFMPLGPASYPRIDQRACLERIREKLKNKQGWYVGTDGRPYPMAYTAEEEQQARRDLFGP